MRKLLFATGEGIGNVLETIPTIRTLKEVLGYEIDMWHAFGSFPIDKKVIPYVDKWFNGNKINNIKQNEYLGIVSTFWTRQHVKPLLNSGMKLLNKPTPLSMDRSEVDTYMDIARDLGVSEEDIIWWGECGYDMDGIDKLPEVDIIIHNGYNPRGSANWKIKSYPYYTDVVNLLNSDGFKVASVGGKSEYVKGTVDFTGLPLLKTFGYLKKCKLFIGNDSGLYHAANALSVDNMVIFTATSIDKNYDNRFHKYSSVIYNDIPCRPCQKNRRWNKDCKDWKCREIDPLYIKDTAYNIISIRSEVDNETSYVKGASTSRQGSARNSF